MADHEQVERFQRLEELFQAAQEMTGPERAAYLDQACAGDASLRQEVEAVLAAQLQATAFLSEPALEIAARYQAQELGQPAAPAAYATQPITAPVGLIGRAINQYAIVAPLGKGGMGEVWLAEDTRLKRKVALKLLPQEFTTDAERVRRFEQEAHAVSALNHPNIITLFDFGQTEAGYFITTEYVKGVTLRTQLREQGRLPVRQTLEISLQICAALATAHEAGIIHRDIKPENVMLRRDGYVKVLDFGLAKLGADHPPDLNAATASLSLTNPGTIMGTVCYMSPEQARGQKIDARTDIFSLGIVLYEMLTGRSPFAGETLSDMLAAILKSEPLPLPAMLPAENSAAATALKTALQRILTQALAKEREARYQTIQALANDLKQCEEALHLQGRTSSAFKFVALADTGQPVASGGGYTTVRSQKFSLAAARWRPIAWLVTALASLLLGLAVWLYLGREHEQTIDSLAVLPFVNVGADPNTEYLSEGVSESIGNSLSQLSQLRVTARGSTSRYKERQTDPLTAGRELGVRLVVTGRVALRGESLTISADLTDVRENRLLWGNQYMQNLSDILKVQEEIARRISEKLPLTSTVEEQQRMTKRHAANAEAYLLYTRGRYFLKDRTKEGADKSIEFMNQAIKADPTYGQAYAGLATAYYGASGLYIDPNAALPRVKAAATKALTLDESLVEAHILLAVLSGVTERNWAEAEQGLKQALELNPNYADAHFSYATHLAYQGRIEEAIIQMNQAYELDPLTPDIGAFRAYYYYLARHYDEAIAQCLQLIKANRNFIIGHYNLGLAYQQKGMFAQAIAEFEEFQRLDPKSSFPLVFLACAYAASGQQAEAHRLLGVLRERERAQKEFIDPYIIGLIYVALGDKEQAFAELEKAYQARTEDLLYLKVEPRLDSLRSDPRFADLVRRLNLTP